jgi:hypothetical protein
MPHYRWIYLKKLTLEATIKDAQEDQYANVFGREQGRKFPNKDSKELVKPLRPDKLNERY